MKKQTWILVTLVLALSLSLGACDISQETVQDGALVASGTIAANDIKISSEIGGAVVEIAAGEGDTVAAGDILFRTDDGVVQAQYDQAQAAVDTASATVSAAQAQVASAQLQYELTLQSARMADIEARNQVWLAAQQDEIALPVWYYEKNERIAALEAEVDNAASDLALQLDSLEKELQDASNDDFIDTETELAETQAALNVAGITLQQAEAANDHDLIDVAQEAYDAVLADLEAVQTNYDHKLTTDAASNVLEARARVAVARTRLDNARDQLIRLQQGEDSLQVAAAQAGVTQAKAAVTQAEANLAQAQAALGLVEIQLDKTTVRSPLAGTVISLNLSEGELLNPGSTAMTIGQLEEVELTVYVPEDRYGEIDLGQGVTITADSFPGEQFEGVVSHIADEAEYTPRNVQTADGRKTTVYAIQILVPNTDQSLKPGMPVDVAF